MQEIKWNKRGRNKTALPVFVFCFLFFVFFFSFTARTQTNVASGALIELAGIKKSINKIKCVIWE